MSSSARRKPLQLMEVDEHAPADFSCFEFAELNQVLDFSKTNAQKLCGGFFVYQKWVEVHTGLPACSEGSLHGGHCTMPGV
jgi:hypothetical protein